MGDENTSGSLEHTYSTAEQGREGRRKNGREEGRQEEDVTSPSSSLPASGGRTFCHPFSSIN